MKKEIYVIKLGSNVLLDNYGIDKNVMENLVNQVKTLKENNILPIIVSSGAVALGKKKLGLSQIKGATNTESKQVFSSIGQPGLMQIYAENFAKYFIHVSQALLTRRDFVDRDRYVCMKKVLLSTLEVGVVPIINENDVLSQEELDFSDNDELSALIAAMVGASKLIILSNIDGLYDKFPDGNLLKTIDIIDENVYKMVGVDKSTMGTGGMESKLNTAKMMMDLGIDMFIANGKKDFQIIEIMNGNNPGTLFQSQKNSKVDSIRKWLKAGAVPEGKIRVSNIISDLLKSHKRASILEIGVEEILKEFKKGEVVSVCDELGEQIGFGISKIDSSTISKNSQDTTKIVIHTDYFINV